MLWIAPFLASGGMARCGAAETHAPLRPNVILINCDDLGYGDLACYGAQDVRTPHLDRMAAEGMRCTDFSVTSPLCTPSRAALLTGRYPGRAGLAAGVLRPGSRHGLGPEEITLGEVARSAGYATGCIGKWHLGFERGMRPLDHGFGSYYGVLHNLDHWETEAFEKEGGMPVLRGDAVEKRPAVPAEMTGLYTAEALRFIRAHQGERFFLYLAHAMPHLPFDASPRFKGKSPRGLYGDVVEELDDSTGQILEELRKRGLAEKTLVLFTSDNGPERRTPGSAGPLRGSKHTVWEGGLRVPFLAWWPGQVPAGKVCSEFLTSLEILPSLAALMGAEVPSGRVLDGGDASGLLLGRPGAASPRQALYSLYGFQANRQEALREGRWKLHLSTPPQLFDLGADLGEAKDLAAVQPEVVQRLSEEARKLRVTLGSSLIRVLVVDGFSNHDWARTTSLIRGVLSAAGGFRVEVATCPASPAEAAAAPFRPALGRHDVVLVNCNSLSNGGQWPEAFREDFVRFVREGGGVFVFHSANNSFAGWEDYDRIIGLGWRPAGGGIALRVGPDGKIERIPAGNGPGTAHGPRGDRLVHRLGEHPIHAGLPGEWMAAMIEVYTYARGPAEGLEVLSWAEDPASGGRWPVEWTVSYGQGRIYNSTLGHVWRGEEEPPGFRCAGFQAILVRALKWLAKRPVDSPVPPDFPGKSRTSLRALPPVDAP